MRVTFALMGALALGGCFGAEAPLFQNAQSVCPFAAPTEYRVVEEGREDKVTFASDGALCKTISREGDRVEESTVLFVPFGQDAWILQEPEGKGPYGIMRRKGDRLYYYLPQCKDFTAKRLTELKIRFDPERKECTVERAEQLEQAFKEWRMTRRKPTSVYRQVKS